MFYLYVEKVAEWLHKVIFYLFFWKVKGGKNFTFQKGNVKVGRIREELLCSQEIVVAVRGIKWQALMNK